MHAASETNASVNPPAVLESDWRGVALVRRSCKRTRIRVEMKNLDLIYCVEESNNIEIEVFVLRRRSQQTAAADGSAFTLVEI